MPKRMMSFLDKTSLGRLQTVSSSKRIGKNVTKKVKRIKKTEKERAVHTVCTKLGIYHKSNVQTQQGIVVMRSIRANWRGRSARSTRKTVELYRLGDFINTIFNICDEIDMDAHTMQSNVSKVFDLTSDDILDKWPMLPLFQKNAEACINKFTLTQLKTILNGEIL